MKKFETPELEIQIFNVEDVITTSATDGITPGGNETPGVDGL